MSAAPPMPPDPPYSAPLPPAPKKDNTLLIVLVIGGVLLGGCCLVGIVAAIAIPRLAKARPNEGAAIGTLRTLTTAQALHREGDKDHNNVLDYAGDLDVLAREGLIDRTLSSGTRYGYRFHIESADEQRWSATAVPIASGRFVGRTFFVDETGEIRSRPDGEGTAGPNDPPLR